LISGLKAVYKPNKIFIKEMLDGRKIGQDN